MGLRELLKFELRGLTLLLPFINIRQGLSEILRGGIRFGIELIQVALPVPFNLPVMVQLLKKKAVLSITLLYNGIPLSKLGL